MPRIPRRFLFFFLIWVLLTGIFPCRSEALSLSASAYVLMDADSGRVLLSQNETDEMAIASTTKIMTALVALEHSRLTDYVTVRREHLREGSSMYLAEGETLTMEALLYGLMLPSGNDAAECIADYCGGGTERFVRWMNEKAASLGMSHTSFANPSGLDAEGHYSCALDMARLMACAMRDPVFSQIVSAKTAAAGERIMTNHNKLLGSLEGCIGGKTGYTGAAGRTLVTCAEREGMRLIAVTLHDGSDWQDHAALYEYGFSSFQRRQAVERGRVCALCAVRGGESTSLNLCAAESFYYPLAGEETLTLSPEVPESVAAPVKAGQTVGETVILLNGNEVGRIDLIAATSVRGAETEAHRPTVSSWLRALFGGKR